MSSIKGSMAAMSGISDVHDLHIWQVSTGIPILTAHIHIDGNADAPQVLQQLEAYARSLGIEHSTIQICNPPGAGNGGAGDAGKGAAGSRAAVAAGGEAAPAVEHSKQGGCCSSGDKKGKHSKQHKHKH